MPTRRIPSGSSSSTIRRRNISSVLAALLQFRRISRIQLARLTGLSPTTITNLIADLVEQGIVAPDDQESPRPVGRRGVGRPQTALHLVPDARFAVGIHFDVGCVRVAVTDLLGHVVALDTLEHPLDCAAEEVLAETVATVGRVIAASGIQVTRLAGVGVGASGLVEPETGVNVFAPNMNWRDVPLRDIFSRQLGLPVIVDNNVRAMALGEALFGAGRDVYSLVFVYARIGVGAGIAVGGHLYYGGGAGAGEIGHTTIVPSGGELCRCGNTGCLETLFSEPAIVRLAQALARQEPGSLLARYLEEGRPPAIERVFDAARAGDTATRAMLLERAACVGIALANLVDILNPELIVLGGILAQGQDILLPVIQDTMRQRAFAQLGDKVRLLSSSFGRDAGVVGAAALALNHFFYRQDAAGL